MSTKTTQDLDLVGQEIGDITAKLVQTEVYIRDYLHDQLTYNDRLTLALKIIELQNSLDIHAEVMDINNTLEKLVEDNNK